MAKKNYAIMRIQKLTSANDFAKASNHNFRKYENTPGVDKDGVIIQEGQYRNYQDIKKYLKTTDKIHENGTDRAVAKNRVRGFELLFAVNQDFMKDDFKRDEYFKLAQEWCLELFGNENYLNSCIHLDEGGAAHMHVMVTCISKDPKNRNCYYAKNWVNNKNSLVELQDSWHAKVEHLGLERGKSAEFTHNYHLTKQEYVKLLQKDLKTVQGLPPIEKDLLAVQGLRKVQELNKISEEIRSHENNKEIISKAIEEVSRDYAEEIIGEVEF